MPKKLNHTPGDCGAAIRRALDKLDRNIEPVIAALRSSKDPGMQTPTRSLFDGIRRNLETALALAVTAPHHCADPACPGDVNRRKLEAFDQMREALHDFQKACDPALVGKMAAQQYERRALAFVERAGDLLALADALAEGGEP